MPYRAFDPRWESPRARHTGLRTAARAAAPSIGCTLHRTRRDSRPVSAGVKRCCATRRRARPRMRPVDTASTIMCFCPPYTMAAEHTADDSAVNCEFRGGSDPYRITRRNWHPDLTLRCAVPDRTRMASVPRDLSSSSRFSAVGLASLGRTEPRLGSAPRASRPACPAVEVFNLTGLIPSHANGCTY